MICVLALRVRRLSAKKRFVKEGAYVFITSRRQAELDKAVAEIGSNVTGVQGDVLNLEDLYRPAVQGSSYEERQARCAVCECGLRRAETNTGREPGALRQDFRHQRVRPVLCGAKGPAPGERE